MGFNPFKEKGVPIEKQFKDWSSLNTRPYDPREVDPYSRCRGILMNGIEVEAVLFYHQFQRHCDDMELKRQLATVRRVEQQQQKMINWAIPAQESSLEVTIGYEQLAVDLTAAMAQSEPDQNVKAALDFGLIEDFDHLYRYSNLYQSLQGREAASLCRDYTEIMPGRPTVVEHRHPFDEVRQPYDKDTAQLLTKLHVATITAAEQQTMNFYMNIGNRLDSEIGRALYQEIGQIEEQHVTQYGSLADPRASWFEMAVLHEYNECYMYYSCMSSEVDPQLKRAWQNCLEQELEHLRIAVELWKRHEKVDATERFPAEFPQLTVLKPAVDYVREIITSQLGFVGDRQRIVPLSKAENQDRIKAFQRLVNSGDYVPSQKVVQDGIDAKGKDYRHELKGPVPVELLQHRDRLPTPEQLISFMAGR